MTYVVANKNEKVVLDLDQFFTDRVSEELRESQFTQDIFAFEHSDSDNTCIDSDDELFNQDVLESFIEEVRNYPYFDQVKFNLRSETAWRLLEDDLMFNGDIPAITRIAILPLLHGGKLEQDPSVKYCDFLMNLIEEIIKLCIESVISNCDEAETHSHFSVLSHLSTHSVINFPLKRYLEGNGTHLKPSLVQLDKYNSTNEKGKWCEQLAYMLFQLDDQDNSEEGQSFYQTIFPNSSQYLFTSEPTTFSIPSPSTASDRLSCSTEGDSNRSSRQSFEKDYSTNNSSKHIIIKKPKARAIEATPSTSSSENSPVDSFSFSEDWILSKNTIGGGSFTLFNSLNKQENPNDNKTIIAPKNNI
jgi:hypothetical protein